MHLTLKTEATRPASPNFLHQQARFDAFLTRYNHERPHQALGMKVPGELYTHSPRPYQGLGELDYPGHDWTVTVTRCGRICYTLNLSRAFAGQNVGVKRSVKRFGSSASCTTISATSMMRPVGSSRSRIRSAQKCCLCLRNNLRICYTRRKINLSRAFAGQNVGVKQVSEKIWLVSFMHYDLGYFDDETCRLEPIENPFSPKVLPMSPE